jgi:N-acetyl-gamma-glutamyl-phosphate reductase
MNKQIKAGIIGGAGYAGGELMRLLVNHPVAEIEFVHSRSQVGQAVTKIHQDLIGEIDMTFTDQLSTEVDVIFLCMGHGQSEIWLKEHPEFLKIPIVDLSRDFRLENADQPHDFVYGLTEWNRGKIQKAKHIANPGCFATCLQLSIFPLIKEQKISNEVHITAITGSSGAGQQPRSTTHFSWRNDNVSVYKAFTHQHMDEIDQLFQTQKLEKTQVNFVPVRGNFTRGIFASTYMKSDLSESDALEIYRKTYADHPFTHISEDPIDLKMAVNTNKCVLHVAKYGDQLHITTIIDNLLKGASGQAVQNMNLMFGLDETSGLKLKAAGF